MTPYGPKIEVFSRPSRPAPKYTKHKNARILPSWHGRTGVCICGAWSGALCQGDRKWYKTDAVNIRYSYTTRIPIVLKAKLTLVTKFARTTMWSGGPQGRDDGVGLVEDSRGEAFF